LFFFFPLLNESYEKPSAVESLQLTANQEGAQVVSVSALHFNVLCYLLVL